MLVVALPSLVVIPQYADSSIDQREPVFGLMTASRERSGKPPDYQFHERGFRKTDPLTDTQFSLHVGVDANANACCQ